MKTVNQIRFERLQRMLEWRVNHPQPNMYHELEADCLDWAISMIMEACSDTDLNCSSEVSK